jgi:hemerythrin superfamily protein
MSNLHNQNFYRNSYTLMPTQNYSSAAQQQRKDDQQFQQPQDTQRNIPEGKESDKSHIIDLIVKDHRTVDSLFNEWKSTKDEKQAEKLQREITKELSAHAAVEEQLLYPALRNMYGAQMADHNIQEHAKVKELLVKLKSAKPLTSDYTSMQDTLINDVRHHVKEEEQDIFPRLKKDMNEEKLREMGTYWNQLKKVAPTEPHPGAPATPPGNYIAGPILSFIDKLKEVITKK